MATALPAAYVDGARSGFPMDSATPQPYAADWKDATWDFKDAHVEGMEWPKNFFDPHIPDHLNEYKDYKPPYGHFIDPQALGCPVTSKKGNTLSVFGCPNFTFSSDSIGGASKITVPGSLGYGFGTMPTEMQDAPDFDKIVQKKAD
eukprot:NODE_2189_length_629_cov_68.173307_g2139_i0.p1 GENE.NODE_2189_length_629_cov_68.173307_g2139_i0~~NODE_2189_length_629_cov_68.173307_g2139_i0.p1  ORF type:complete len:146 (-),score=31.97 NODE_2189_length_629_cov_68.173307_g2139_i0:122-559(-)